MRCILLIVLVSAVAHANARGAERVEAKGDDPAQPRALLAGPTTRESSYTRRITPAIRQAQRDVAVYWEMIAVTRRMRAAEDEAIRELNKQERAGGAVPGIRLLLAEWQQRAEKSRSDEAQVLASFKESVARFTAMVRDLGGSVKVDEAAREQPIISLALDWIRVTDTDVKKLVNLATIQNLHLCGTKITDAGLMSLAALPDLKTLDVRETKVTAKGVNELKQRLPNLIIQWQGPATRPAHLADARDRAVPRMMTKAELERLKDLRTQELNEMTMAFFDDKGGSAPKDLRELKQYAASQDMELDTEGMDAVEFERGLGYLSITIRWKQPDGAITMIRHCPITPW